MSIALKKRSHLFDVKISLHTTAVPLTKGRLLCIDSHIVKMNFPLPTTLFITFMLLPVVACAERVDSLRHNDLGEAQVTTIKSFNPLKGSSAAQVHWDMKQLQALPQILGNADPIRYLQTLPSVQTSTEYDAGLHVQGCNNGQNAILLGKAVVYNPSHLMGIFSTFNSSHFKALHFTTQSSADSPSRLGGVVQMELPSLPIEAPNIIADKKKDNVGGEVSLGPLTSQGTLQIAPTSHALITLSARQAYFNLLYSKWLDFGGDTNKYGFGDYNATINLRLGNRHHLMLNGYYGQDRLQVVYSGLNQPSSLHWSNAVGEVSWLTTLKHWQLTQSLTYSASQSQLKLNFNDTQLHIPAHINTLSYQAAVTSQHAKVGAEVLLHNVQPQNPQVNNRYGTDIEPQALQRTQEYTCFALYNTPLPFIKGIETELGIRTTFFHTADYALYVKANPSALLTWNIRDKHRLQLQGSIEHQFLHQTGFTSLGMPTEFWFASSQNYKPQRAESVSILYDAETRNKAWRIAAQIYYKRLHHQTEYDDNVLSLLEGIYSLDKALLKGKGKNYGFGIQLTRQQGRITGWVGYAYGRSRRSFNNARFQGTYPSNYERLHEFNLNVMWRATAQLSFSSTALCASGTPFTAPKGFYMINGYVVADYGQRNAARIPTYFRVDLAMNYEFKPRTPLQRFRHSLNVSLFNALGIKNTLFYRLKTSADTFYYGPVRFLKYPLPSFNYKLSF